MDSFPSFSLSLFTLSLPPPSLSFCFLPPLPSSSPSQEVLGRWEVPIYNDTYVMLFFGLLKKLVSKWLTTDANQVSKTLDSSERERSAQLTVTLELGTCF